MAHILIVGKSFSGLKTYLAQHGHDYTVLQDALSTKFPEKRFKNRVVTHFTNNHDLLQAVDTVHRSRPIDGVLVTYERYIASAASISRHLGTPGMSETSALACTDKSRMRDLFAQASTKISPDFAVVSNEQDVRSFAAAHTFPLIIKPANLSKSLLVTKSSSLEELLDNYHKTIGQMDAVYQQYAPEQQPKLLIEEFLEGPIYSVDAFVDATGEPHVLENVVDYQTGYDIGYDDNFHYSRLLPSRLASHKIEEIRRVAAVGCRALGMTSSPAHIEIIYTADGPRIVEIGARNGGYRERMHALANGIDITKNAVALSLDQPLDSTSHKKDNVGVFELFPKTPGIFRGIANEAALRSLPSLNYLSIKAKPGQLVGKAGDGYKMCAVVILHHSDATQFDKDMHYLNTQCAVLA